MQKIIFSVVVCTYNREDLLPDCLQSLADQVFNHTQYEVIVVNNSSTDNTLKVAEEFTGRQTNSCVVNESNQGLSHARNRGVAEAQGVYVAFIDDDARAPKNWLETAASIVEAHAPDIFGGMALPLLGSDVPPWYKESYGTRGDMGETGWLKKGFIVGTNIFFRKSLLEEYGGFDPELGMKGDSVGYHEETALVYRAFAEDRKVYYAKELAVKDHVPDYKLSLAYFLYSKYKVGYDGVKLWGDKYPVESFPEILDLLDNAMNSFDFALRKRDTGKYLYPENYIVEELAPLLVEIGKRVKYFKGKDLFQDLEAINYSVSMDEAVQGLVEKNGYWKTVKALIAHMVSLGLNFSKKKEIIILPDSPLLSIIIPNYNNELYLRDCIESILTQTYKNFEIIVSDDASTDSSVAILRKYEQLHGDIIKCLYHDTNRGVSFNRHSAILQARGEYITTIDSDDYYCDEKKLEKEMEIILSHREKFGKDVCAFSNIVQVTAEKELIQVVGTPETIREGIIFDGIISRDCFIPRDFVFSKSAYFEVGGFDTSLKIYEDWDLKIRLAARHEFYYSGLNGIGYRRHGSGLSSAPMQEHIEFMEKIFRKNFHLAPNVDRQGIAERFSLFLAVLRKQVKHTTGQYFNNQKSKSVFTKIYNKLKLSRLC